MISGVLPRKEELRKEFDSLLSVGVPRKLRLGDCTLLRMSIDCLLRYKRGNVLLFRDDISTANYAGNYNIFFKKK